MSQHETGLNTGDAIFLVVLPPAGAERNIAGLAAVARIGAEILRSGGHELWLVSDRAYVPSAAAEDDVARACHALPIRLFTRSQLGAALVERGSTPFVILWDNELVTAPALQTFLQSGRTTLVASGHVVAARVAASDVMKRLEVRGAPTNVLELSGGTVPLNESGRIAHLLLKSAGKSTDGIVSRWINRPMSRRISAFLLSRMPWVRPGHMTLFTTLVGVAMLFCLLFGGYTGLVAGALLFQTASMLDGVDGEIARTTCRSSARGAALDSASDMAVNVMFLIGFTHSVSNLYGPDYLLVGTFGVLAFVLGLAGIALLARRNGEPINFDLFKHHYRERFRSGPAHVLFATLMTIASRDFFAFLFAVLAVFGLGWSIPWLFALAAVVWVSAMLAALPAILRRERSAAAVVALQAE